MRSPRLQTKLFFRKSPKPLTGQRYTKNHTIAFFIPPFFNMASNESELHHSGTTNLSLGRIRSLFHDEDMRRTWLTRNASWRKMFVSQPPIEEIHWKVTREDQPEPGGRMWPEKTALFKFPDGLRMGAFYDLILGTTSRYHITWPSLECHRESFEHSDPPSETEWKVYQVNTKKYRRNAILIHQYVFMDDRPEYQQREMFWNPTDLRKYRQNLATVKSLVWKEVAGGGMKWTYESHGNDAEAMECFLRATQEPGHREEEYP
ncbi:uncharacterized protein F4812DRAFT_327351 [Daldinia caldariorum]|uniref:uncharacterized protein n=1 Tax=Daldinia caldariorum TaxID=326644 RepID=UPI002007B42E|nr:uncharacterized protein F4812DRAFT_327351 [Daldinia caldariorum]KAI1469374.1 hypothetical protein F4812DRAFT_327351 [Daldinia caldariorum]